MATGAPHPSVYVDPSRPAGGQDAGASQRKPARATGPRPAAEGNVHADEPDRPVGKPGCCVAPSGQRAQGAVCGRSDRAAESARGPEHGDAEFPHSELGRVESSAVWAGGAYAVAKTVRTFTDRASSAEVQDNGLRRIRALTRCNGKRRCLAGASTVSRR